MNIVFQLDLACTLIQLHLRSLCIQNLSFNLKTPPFFYIIQKFKKNNLNRSILFKISAIEERLYIVLV
jgi:hypothetical protein